MENTTFRLRYNTATPIIPHQNAVVYCIANVIVTALWSSTLANDKRDGQLPCQVPPRAFDKSLSPSYSSSRLIIPFGLDTVLQGSLHPDYRSEASCRVGCSA